MQHTDIAQLMDTQYQQGAYRVQNRAVTMVHEAGKGYPGATLDVAWPPYVSWLEVLMDAEPCIIDGTPIAFNGSGGGGALGLGVGVPFYIITPPSRQ
jgi:hypothetical protein